MLNGTVIATPILATREAPGDGQACKDALVKRATKMSASRVQLHCPSASRSHHQPNIFLFLLASPWFSQAPEKPAGVPAVLQVDVCDCFTCSHTKDFHCAISRFHLRVLMGSLISGGDGKWPINFDIAGLDEKAVMASSRLAFSFFQVSSSSSLSCCRVAERMLAMAPVAPGQVFSRSGNDNTLQKYVICEALNHEDLK